MLIRDWLLLVLFLSLVLGGCNSLPVGQGPDSESPPLIPEAFPSEQSIGTPSPLEATPEATNMPLTPPVEKVVALARTDLANRLAVTPDKILLVRTEEKLWLDAALGCPRPGVFYPAGRVPGFQVWLDVAGTEYIYNTDFNGTLILCPELNPSVPNLPGDPTPGVPIR